MHNPLALMTKDILDALVAKGHIYFVREPYERGLEPGIKCAFLLTDYKDQQRAAGHFNLLFTPVAKFYDANIPEDKARLHIAATQPDGYKIYVPYLSTRTWEPPKELIGKIKRYIAAETTWKPQQGEVIQPNLFIELGKLFLTLRKGRSEIKVPLADIEKY